jgi:hypothetical protein
MVSSELPVAGDDEKSKRKANLAAGRKTSGGERKSKTSVSGTAKTGVASDQKKTKSSPASESKQSKTENTGENSNVEPTILINDPVAAMEGTDRQGTAEASNAKNVQSQTPEERHETKPADEIQLDKREGIGSDSGQRGDR